MIPTLRDVYNVARGIALLASIVSEKALVVLCDEQRMREITHWTGEIMAASMLIGIGLLLVAWSTP